MNPKFHYDYTEIDEESTSQYDDLLFTTGVPVKARYIHAAAESDAGNPLIEALPRPLITAQDIRNAYAKPMFGYTFNPNKSQFQRLSEISLLDTIRFPLPYHQRLEQENSGALLSAYRLKEIMSEGNGPVISVGNAYDMSPIGYSLLGTSGSGKSSSLRILLSHYPQVIEHNISGIGRFYQIVYLMVNATPNSNFQALYKDIARAIDRALGYTEAFYEAMVKPRMSLGEASSFISGLLEKFSVGELIIDEIQMMSFNQSKENSYQTLAVLSNNTKTPIIVVGTEEAVGKIFNQQWTSRRIGATIASDLYCTNFSFFKIIVERLSSYQWGREPQRFSDEAIELLFRKTNGVIGYLIMLYSRIQMDIIQNDAQDAYQASQINRIADFYYAGLEKLLQQPKNSGTKKIDKSVDEIDKLKAELQGDLDQAIQNEQSKQMIESSAQDINIDEMKQYVVDRIKELTDNYNSETIVKAFNVVFNKLLRIKEPIDKKKLLRLTIERLKTGKTDLRPKSHKASPETLARMKNELTSTI